MRPVTLTLTGLAATLGSRIASAHVGEHHDLGLFPGLAHLLTEHALPIAAIALAAGGLLLIRRLRA